MTSKALQIQDELASYFFVSSEIGHPGVPANAILFEGKNVNITHRIVQMLQFNIQVFSALTKSKKVYLRDMKYLV